MPFISFKQINNTNGLSSNIVNCIVQDSRGFIWVGTNDGLNRYDGLTFTIFRNIPADTTTISGNIITDIVEDKKGNLWIATTDGGISKYNHKQPPHKQFKQYKHNPSLQTSIPTNVVNALLCNEKKLWVATGGAGVLVFDIEAETFLRSAVLSTVTFTSLCYVTATEIWAGRQGGGYCIINPQNNKYTINSAYNNLYKKLPFMAVNKLLLVKDSVYIASWDKALYAVATTSKKNVSYTQCNKPNSFIEDEIIAMAADKKGNIWLGGKLNGLQYFDKQKNKFFKAAYNPSNNGTIADNKVNCVFVDKHQLVWVGTDKGISLSNPNQQQFQQIFIPSSNSNEEIILHDFYKESSEVLWIGTNNGLYKYTNKQFKHIPLKYKGVKLQVTKFFKDQQSNQLYIGTNYTLFKLNLKNFKLTTLPNTHKDLVMNKLIESRITSIIKDTIENNECILVTPYGHYIAWYNLQKQQWFSRTTSSYDLVNILQIKDHLIKKIYKTPYGELLFANTKLGLGMWKHNTSKPIQYQINYPNKTTSISNNNVHDFCVDPNENIWVSTYGGGLNYYNSKSKTFLQIKKSPNLCEGIMLDNKQNIWGISNGNLFTYQPLQNNIHIFTLPDFKKTTGVFGNIFKENDTSFYIKGKGYFIGFNPLVVKQFNDIPAIVFTDFKIFNNSYSHWLQQQKIILNYKQNVFSVVFSAPQYLSNQFISFYAKLVGKDENWLSLGTHNVASFNNLSNGTYTLQIKAINSANNTESIASLIIIVTPPYWKTWWFILFIFVFATTITWLIYKYHIAQILQQHLIRNKIAQDLHDNMGSTLSSISVYSAVAKIYTEQKREEDLNVVLDKIGVTANTMIGDMNDIVWSLQPTNDIIDKIASRIESFAKPLCVAKNMQLTILVSETAKNIQLPMSYGKNVYLILKEAINNAVKYSQASVVEITIEQKSKLLYISIIDNGIGFNTETVSSGNGLKNIKERVAEMKGTCYLQNNINAGVSYKINIPLI